MKSPTDSNKNLVPRRSFLMGSLAGASGMVLPRTGEGSETMKPSIDMKQTLGQCLGGPWPEPCDLRPVLGQSENRQGYRIEPVTYEVEAGDPVSALVLVPDGVDANHPAPAVAVWHQHNGEYHLGKSEPAGLAGNPMHHTGVALAKEGYVVLCPDALCFETRQNAHLKGSKFERYEFLRYVVAGQCMAWKNILDMRRAVDYLCSRPDVLSDRLGCYGHSMGSTHTWLVGPWEPRLKCLVGNCCLPTYAAIHRTHILHCFPNFIPGWLQVGDTPDIAAMIAPRALHLNFGALDTGSPICEVRAAVKTIGAAYEHQGVKALFDYYIEENSGHVLSPPMWERTRAWFSQHL